MKTNHGNKNTISMISIEIKPALCYNQVGMLCQMSKLPKIIAGRCCDEKNVYLHFNIMPFGRHGDTFGYSLLA
jgi:hypothetical protein